MKKFFAFLIIFVSMYWGYHNIYLNNSSFDDDEEFEEESEGEIKTYTNNKDLDEYEFLKNAKPPKKLLAQIENESEEPLKTTKTTSDLEDSSGETGATIEGRKVIGTDFRNLQTLPHDYVFGNEYNSNWKSLALKEFNDDEDSDAKIEILSEDSLVFIREKEAMFIEKVKITVSESDGNSGEFMAYVDSSNGEVLHAWDPASDPKGGSGSSLFEDEDDEDDDFSGGMEQSIDTIPEDFDSDEEE